MFLSTSRVLFFFVPVACFGEGIRGARKEGSRTSCEVNKLKSFCMEAGAVIWFLRRMLTFGPILMGYLDGRKKDDVIDRRLDRLKKMGAIGTSMNYGKDDNIFFAISSCTAPQFHPPLPPSQPSLPPPPPILPPLKYFVGKARDGGLVSCLSWSARSSAQRRGGPSRHDRARTY